MSEMEIAIPQEVFQAVRRKKETGELEPAPDFSEIPIPTDYSNSSRFLPDLVEEIIGDSTVEARYTVNSRNPLMRVHKTIISKLTRCAVFPLAQRLTETNFAFKTSESALACELENQKNAIQELMARVDFLERTLELADNENPNPQKKR